MTHEKQFDLSLNEVIPRLRITLDEMRAAPDRNELEGIDPDIAFELGYETAIHDLVRLTSPDPLETGVITYTKAETDAES